MAPPDAMFIILQIIKNKANLQANHHPTRHHAENCLNISHWISTCKKKYQNKNKNSMVDFHGYFITVI